MDFITVAVNVARIRDNMPMDHGISIPEIFFNSKVNQPQATVFISSEFEKASLDTVKAQIQEKYYMTYYSLQNLIPELSKDDFVLRVNRLTTDPDHRLFGECKKGNIVFH